MEKICTIIHTNDIHNSFNDNGVDRIGLAKLKTYVDTLREENETPVYLVDCGDMFEELPILGDISDKLIPIVNKMGYDMTSMGNHELDFGPERALKRQNSIKSHNIIGINNDYSITGNMISYVLDDDTTISFIGAISKETFKKTPKQFLEDIEIMKPYQVISDKLGRMSYTKRHFVAIISHLGMKQKECPSNELAARLPNIHAVIDAHDHSCSVGLIYGVTHTSAGKYLRGVGVIDVYHNGDDFVLDSKILKYKDFKNVKPNKEIQKMITSLKFG